MWINEIALPTAELDRSDRMGSGRGLPEQTVCLPGVVAISVCYAALGPALGTITDAALAASCSALADRWA